MHSGVVVIFVCFIVVIDLMAGLLVNKKLEIT
jgi:hypothetical protein